MPVELCDRSAKRSLPSTSQTASRASTDGGDYWRLRVGGLSLRASVPAGWSLIETDPAYTHFLSVETPVGQRTSRPARAADVEIDLTFEPASFQCADQFRDLPLLFDTQETWQVRQDGDDLLLRLAIPTAEATTELDYLWLARFSADPRQRDRITIHCGALLRHEVESGGCGLLQNPLHYPLDQLLLDFLLPRHGGFICHGAGLMHRGSAIVCAGKSGAGKTTLSRLVGSAQTASLLSGDEGSYGDERSHWNHLPAPANTLHVLSDDRVVLRQDDSGARLYGTPWPGEGRMAINASAPLAALVFLRHAKAGEEDRLQRLDPAQALDRLLPVASILWFDRSRLDQALDVCAELVATIPAYELTFRPEPSALELLLPLFRQGEAR